MAFNLKYVEENRDALVDSIAKRYLPFDGEEVNKLLSLYSVIKVERAELDKLRQRRNEIELGRGKEAEKREEAKELRVNISQREKELEEKEAQADEIFLKIPNLLDKSVPIAKDESGNLELKKVGDVPAKDFEVKSAEDLAESKGLLDLESAAKISGSRFIFLKGKLVQLALALEMYSINKLVEKGYMAVLPPLLMKEGVYKGIAHMSTFEDALYRVTGKEETDEGVRFLISTTEHPLIAMYSNKTIDESDLPIKLVGESPAFRKEAGAHGKDTKGMFRLHQFDQTEQIAICKPEESSAIQEEFLANEEEMLKELGLPYRVMLLSSGDMGVRDFKQYDLEVFMPFQKKYREVMSNDNCTDWISRRSNIKIADKSGNKVYAHTVDATGLAIQRIIKAILEVYQEKDGTVKLPPAIVKYTGFSEL
ncbi:MAG: serine--tRNA ligase [Candidatus Acidifodinimicrobium sp.]